MPGFRVFGLVANMHGETLIALVDTAQKTYGIAFHVLVEGGLVLITINVAKAIYQSQ
jgi:hypothetical protein